MAIKDVSSSILTSKSAEVCHNSIRDVSDLDERGIVGLGYEGAVGDAEASHGDVYHVAAHLHGGELNPEHPVTGVNHLVGNVTFLWT